MNYSKHLRKILNHKGDRANLVGVALISGIAVGAALAVLFAPKKGKELRKSISDASGKAGGSLADLMNAIKAKFGGAQEVEHETDHDENAAHARPGQKKPKSDIGELLHQAHQHNPADDQTK